jgi:mono/diheme cytochrome c family protein
MQRDGKWIGCRLVWGCGGLMALWLGGAAFSTAHSQTAPGAPVPQAPPDPLVWDAVQKELTPPPDVEKADFTFSVTNVSTSTVVITHVQPSCGCTVATLPSDPWVLPAGSNGQMSVTVDLAGKSGELYKTLNVYASNAPTRTLVLVVHMALSPEMKRAQNQMVAMADRQAVFKGDCATCHVEKGRGKTGKELYAASCGICHDSAHRATMVPNLGALNKSTDEAYWKQWIRNGKPGTLMPGFASDQGGPLTDEQIDGLARVLSKVYPSTAPVVPAPNPSTNAMGTAPAQRKVGGLPK